MSGKSSTRKPSGRVQKHYKRQRRSAPPFERIPHVPVPSGIFLARLLALKNEAFAYLEKHPPKHDYKTRTPPSNRSISGYISFKLYYEREFYGLPITMAACLISDAWNACPDKHTWDYYAHEYSRFSRTKSFLSWLKDTEKIVEDLSVLFVDSPTLVKST